jgi:hypothetical protein
MGCDNSLGRKDIFKFVYCFMIISLTIDIFKHFLLLVPFSHQGITIMFFGYLLLELKLTYEFI